MTLGFSTLEHAANLKRAKTRQNALKVVCDWLPIGYLVFTGSPPPPPPLPATLHRLAVHPGATAGQAQPPAR
jgi:hypothetical protein